MKGEVKMSQKKAPAGGRERGGGYGRKENVVDVFVNSFL